MSLIMLCLEGGGKLGVSGRVRCMADLLGCSYKRIPAVRAFPDFLC